MSLLLLYKMCQISSINPAKYLPILIILINRSAGISSKLDQSLTNAIHRTQAAQERVNTLWCHECNTMDHGESCTDSSVLNTSNHIRKCMGDEFVCMVKRFSYTTSTENSTSPAKMWSLERRCSGSCESGCIVIGERTKLYACTSCCETSFCNTGKGSASRHSTSIVPMAIILLLIVIKQFNRVIP